MKGKGKGKEKSSSDEPIDLKDLPITLPEFANGNDHAKYFPRFSSVLKRSDQDGVGKLLIEISFNFNLIFILKSRKSFRM